MCDASGESMFEEPVARCSDDAFLFSVRDGGLGLFECIRKEGLNFDETHFGERGSAAACDEIQFAIARFEISGEYGELARFEEPKG